MAPRSQLNYVPLQTRSDSSPFSLKPCPTAGQTTSFLQSCCPSSATCIPKSNSCILPFLPSQKQAGQLLVKQVECVVRQAETTNSTSPSASGIDVIYPGSYLTSVPSLYSTPMDGGGDDESSATPLLFTYPLLILAFLAFAMGGAYTYYRLRKVRCMQDDENALNGNNDCPNNDSTVDLELPSYEQHAWNSRWAPYGRNRRGESGDIVEVVQLRGERGVLVPVAVVRGSMYVEPGSEIEAAGNEIQESRSKRWITIVKEKLGRGSRGHYDERQRQDSEWSVDPPAYVERTGEVSTIKAPEPAVTR